MRTRLCVCLVVAAICQGCMQHTYKIGTGAPEDAPVVYKHWQHHWLFGLIRPKLQKELDVARVCPSGNATVHEEMSFVNGLVDILTTFIYAPTTVTITCDDGTSVEVELSEDDVARITTDPRFIQLVVDVAPERLADLRLFRPTSDSALDEIVVVHDECGDLQESQQASYR